MNYVNVDSKSKYSRTSSNKKSMFHYMDLFRSKYSENLSTNKPHENIYVGLVENNQIKVSLFSISNLGLRLKNSEKYKKYYAEKKIKKKTSNYYPYNFREETIRFVNHPFISSSDYFGSSSKRQSHDFSTYFYNPIKLSLLDSSENVIYSCTISPIGDTCKNIQIVNLSPDGSTGNDGPFPSNSLLAGYRNSVISCSSYRPCNSSNFIFSKRDYALVFNLDLEIIKNINNIKLEFTEYLDN